MLETVTQQPAVAAPSGRRVAGTLAAVVVAGFLSGALTSLAQGVLPGGFASLANGVAPWLVVPFAAGAAARRWGWAVVAGVLACAAQVPGYYVTADLRGFPVGTTWTLFWLLAALPAGIVAGLAGWSWWRSGTAASRPGAGRERGLGAAVLVAAWLAEAGVTYVWALGYAWHATVHVAAAVVTLVLLGRHGRQHAATLRWLGPAVVLAAAGFWTLGQV